MRLRYSPRQLSYRSLAFALYLTAVLLGFAVTSGGYLNTTLEDNPWLGPAIIGTIIAAGAATLFYNLRVVRLTASLFPLLMVVTLVFNQTEDKVGWDLRRQPSNSWFDFGGWRKSYGAYFYLADHFEGATLVTAPDLLPSTTLEAWSLYDWGRLREVTIEEYDPILTQAEAERLIPFEPVRVVTADGSFMFVSDPDFSTDRLYLARYNNITYFVASSVFTALREDS